MSEKSKYPEHEKLNEVHEDSQTIGDFIEWIQTGGFPGMKLCQIDEYGDGNFYPKWTRTEDILAAYYDIDLEKIDKEKREMLEEIRRKNSQSP